MLGLQLNRVSERGLRVMELGMMCNHIFRRNAFVTFDDIAVSVVNYGISNTIVYMPPIHRVAIKQSAQFFPYCKSI